MEPAQHYAYNRTRESFLALDVTVGEFTFAMLEAYLPGFVPKTGSGLWLVPFRGMPDKGIRAPLDLVYLDADSQVLDTVESFPAFTISASRPLAASVLVLPAHSIFTSQTKPGDQLLLCPAAEMSWRLQQLDPRAQEPHLPALPVSERPNVLPIPLPEVPAADGAGTLTIKPAAKPAATPRNWLKRLLHPDPPDNRYARRQPAPGLVAYFFTGGSPQAHVVRDVSPTGLYIVTAERWYPGTLIRLTLTRTNAAKSSSSRSISVHAVAVRWGNDGVGLQFVIQQRRGFGGASSGSEGVDASQLAEFLNGITRDFSDKIAS